MGCREKDTTGYKMYRTKHLITDLNEKENYKFSHMPCCLLTVQKRIKTKKIKKPIYTFMYFKAVYTHIYLSVHNYAHFYTPIIHIFYNSPIYVYLQGMVQISMWVFLFLRKKRKLAVRNNLTFNGDSIEGRLPV